MNEFQDMLSLIDMGVDGIITDYPNVLREALKKREINLPPQLVKIKKQDL